MKKLLFTVVGILSLISSPIHAAGITANFADSWPAITEYTSSKVNVLVIDNRPYVLSGSKKESFVGIARNGYGVPFDINTDSAQPLSRDVEIAVSKGFMNAGVDSAIVEPASRGNRKANGANERLLVITISEWKSDSYSSTYFTYKTNADIYNNEGKLLASKAIEDAKSFSSPLDAGREALSRLLNSSEITKALSDTNETASNKQATTGQNGSASH